MSAKTAVLLLQMGGPDSLDAVEPFLLNLFADRDIIRIGPAFLQPLISRIIVKRRAPWNLSAIPSSHCASVIWNKSICGTAPAMLRSASILPKRSSVPLMTVSAD